MVTKLITSQLFLSIIKSLVNLLLIKKHQDLSYLDSDPDRMFTMDKMPRSR